MSLLKTADFTDEFQMRLAHKLIQIGWRTKKTYRRDAPWHVSTICFLPQAAEWRRPLMEKKRGALLRLFLLKTSSVRSSNQLAAGTSCTKRTEIPA